jgi:hypothetical protein
MNTVNTLGVESNIVNDDIINSLLDKLHKYILPDSDVNAIKFERSDYIGLTYMWLGISVDKAMFTILKVMPNTFAQIIKDNQTAWDDMISSVISDPKFDVLFPIIITSVTWELFSNSLQNQTEG